MEQLPIQKPYISCPRLRISDILLLDKETEAEVEEEEEERNGGGGGLDMNCLRWKKHDEEAELKPKVECPSPQKTITRWMKSMVEKKKVVKGREKVGRGCVVVDLDRRMERKFDGRHSSSTIASRLEQSGSHRKESMLNLGVACSLLYIIASSKNELNKMKVLCTELDATLQKVRAVMKRKDSLYEPSESKDCASSCLTDIKEVLSCSSQYSRQSHSKLCPSEQETLTTCESMKDDKSKRESPEGIDELEAELEAELERLQLQLDGEGFSKYSQHHSTRTVVEDTALSSSCVTAGEVINPRDVPLEFQCGVHPVELERKLHELLESRQQERIEELEAALKRAEKKLQAKEKEISWWKDTALIISQHAVESSHSVMQQNAESF